MIQNLFKVTTDGTTLGNVDVNLLHLIRAANKSYVDSVAPGLDVKDSVRAASTTDVNTGTSASIDGVTLSAGDRILKDQIYSYTKRYLRL